MERAYKTQILGQIFLFATIVNRPLSYRDEEGYAHR